MAIADVYGLSTSVVVAIWVFSITVGVIWFAITERRRRSRLKMNPSKESPTNKDDLVYNNLPRFWTIPRILTIIVGFALVVFGADYFWNTPGITPLTDLWAGFAFVMMGVIIASFSLLTGLIFRSRAINRARNPQE
ncbi:MAG: hypothetical protein ACRECH_07550 [Nitrososphaerales archaeon]